MSLSGYGSCFTARALCCSVVPWPHGNPQPPDRPAQPLLNNNSKLIANIRDIPVPFRASVARGSWILCKVHALRCRAQRTCQFGHAHSGEIIWIASSRRHTSHCLCKRQHSLLSIDFVSVATQPACQGSHDRKNPNKRRVLAFSATGYAGRYISNSTPPLSSSTVTSSRAAGRIADCPVTSTSAPAVQ